MGAIASQITSLTIVYSTVYSDADERKHQRSTSLAFVRGIHRRPVNSSHKWPKTRKMFPFDDVIILQVCVRYCDMVLQLIIPVAMLIVFHSQLADLHVSKNKSTSEPNHTGGNEMSTERGQMTPQEKYTFNVYSHHVCPLLVPIDATELSSWV